MPGALRLPGGPAVTELRDRVRAAAEGKRARPRKKEWQAPLVTDFATGSVLSFDQTITHTGWCLLHVVGGRIDVAAKGTINEPPTPDLRSFMDTLQRAVYMAERVGAVVRDNWEPGVHVVAEMPAVMGYRIESSLLGAMGVWQAVVAHTPRARPHALVGKQHMEAVLVSPDDRMNGKPAVKRALSRYLDVGTGWNQHNRDALANGLTYLYDLKQTP